LKLSKSRRTSTRNKSMRKSRGGGYTFDLNNPVACGEPAVVWQNDYFYDTIGGAKKRGRKAGNKARGGNLDDRDFSCKQPMWGPQCL
jgi:hypothetical protein